MTIVAPVDVESAPRPDSDPSSRADDFVRHLSTTWYKNQISLRNAEQRWRAAAGAPRVVRERALGDRLWSIPGQLAPDLVVAGCWDRTIYGLHAETLTDVWAVRTGAPVYSSPAVLPDGSFVIGCEDGRLRRISRAGELQWELRGGGAFHGTATLDRVRGLAIAPCFDQRVRAVDLATGAVRWEYDCTRAFRDVDPEGVYSSPALLPDGSVVFGSDYDFLRVREGACLWRTATDALVESTPALDWALGLGVIGSTDRRVLGFDTATGAVRWSVTTGGAVLTSPALAPCGTVCIASDDGHAYGIAAATGEPRWRTALAAPGAPPRPAGWTSIATLPGGDFLLVAGDGALVRLAAATGAMTARLPFPRGVHSPPLVTTSGAVIVGSHFGTLYRVEWGAP